MRVQNSASTTGEVSAVQIDTWGGREGHNTTGVVIQHTGSSTEPTRHTEA
jgi:hypothetical protein